MANQKNIKIDEKQTSSAATKYGDADVGWLGKIKGLFTWIKIPQIDPGKIWTDIKGFFSKNILDSIGGFIKSQVDRVIKKVEKLKDGMLGAIVKVSDQIKGQLNTAAGQGLALFTTIGAGAIGGAVLLGAGPEVIGAMLNLYQLGYNFNFNQTDEQIQQQIDGQTTSLFAVGGQAFGMGLASLASGGGFKIPKVQINVSKIAILYRSLNNEARQQLISQIQALSRTAFFGGLRIFTNMIYRDIRKALKDLAKSDPNNWMIKMIPGGAETVRNWGKGGPPFSFGIYTQNFFEGLQSSKNPFVKNIGVFMENAAESFGESIQEFLPDLVRQPVV